VPGVDSITVEPNPADLVVLDWWRSRRLPPIPDYGARLQDAGGIRPGALTCRARR
jgi:hypothetical protein